MNNDNDKMNELLVEHEGLCHWAANEFKYGEELHYEERFAAAQIGLWLALQRWDPERGALSTFAKRWMQAEIRREIAARHGFRLSTFATAIKIRRAASDLRTLLEHEPDNVELAEATGHAPETIAKHRDALGWAIELDAPAGEEGSLTISETIGDGAPGALDGLIRDELLAMLDELDPRERDIVTGYLAGEAIGSVGEALGISQSRAYQVFDEGIAKLRRLLAERDPEAAARLDAMTSIKRSAA